jgi:hypothetical protein
VDLQARKSRLGTVRYWSRSWYLYSLGAIAVIKLGFGIWITWSTANDLAAGSWAKSTRPWAVSFIVLGGLLIVLACWLLMMVLRPALVLTADTLLISRGAFHTTCVSVADIAGLGLIFRRCAMIGSQRPPDAWFLAVWQGAQPAVRTAISYLPALTTRRDARALEKYLAIPSAIPAPGSRRLSLDEFDPASQTDGEKLAATYAGRVAREIYHRVLAQQGPGGPLAVTEQQKHPDATGRWATDRIVAFWSPDGILGRPGQTSAR